MMNPTRTLWIWLPILFLINITDAEVCYRRYIERKQGCRGKMKKNFHSAEACCQRNKAAGYALIKENKGKKLYVCTPCTDIPYRSNVIHNVVPSSAGRDGLIPPLGRDHQQRRPDWGPWSQWSKCSASCMAGVQERIRSCNLASQCNGQSRQTRSCSVLAYCPVDGKWAPWYAWGPCSKSCGGGTQARHRRCNNPPPMHGGRPCSGNATKVRSCNERSCPVDGKWTEWNEFTQCTATCGPGVKVRFRQCDNPPPTYGGRYCKGRPYQYKKCQEKLCPINGGWSLWSSWSKLTVSCGEGVSQRTRDCNSPKPKFGGGACVGEKEQLRMMNASKPCPVNGRWSNWTSYGQCQAPPCQKGYQLRSRTCTNPRPQHGGQYCKGSLIERQECVNHVECVKVNGGWCPWGDWGECSLDCGSENDISFQKRIRHCDCSLPKNGGSDCSGVRFETRNCHIKPCNNSDYDVTMDTNVDSKDLEFVLKPEGRESSPDDSIVIDETTLSTPKATQSTSATSGGRKSIQSDSQYDAPDEYVGSGHGPSSASKREPGSGCTPGGSGDGSDGSCDQEPEDIDSGNPIDDEKTVDDDLDAVTN